MPSVADELIQLLRRRHLLTAEQLRTALGVSPATLMRAVRAVPRGEVLGIGRARRSAYALRRPLRGSMAPLPLYAVDAAGRADQVGLMHLAHPHGTLLELTGHLDDFEWPLVQRGTRMQDGWFEGVPYFLQDMRPQGFLGRQFARANAAMLQVSEDPVDWSDDDTLHALSMLGADQPGNLIIGEAALRLWQAAQNRGPAREPIAEGEEAPAYVELAAHAMSLGHQGSSAGGEFPKFGAARTLGGVPAHVLVKFSGSDGSPGTQRWSDLLTCEQLASEIVSTLEGLEGARSRILQAGHRTFLEVERFDRHSMPGRSGLCSWAAINADWFGLHGRSWVEGATALAGERLIDTESVRAVERLVFFGRLIGNTDMHDGNLSFRPGARTGTPLRLAPVYDMLPMAYRPQVGVELPDVTFTPQLPLPGQRDTWSEAASAAMSFWRRAADDPRISASFRKICERNADLVADARRRA
ncbi:type II toxin-antitoxin system HipA family toxin YjjJ [Roseateles sp.]|uniref:type II toxin-antitoxin system HipA family toxin YjjJ n=1 Tax=Roseateles sp. TaxID=1971397 RepID=UPI0025D01073|nr:type II toxin-antitoxin system HipA family toxin YjjJ [Roseateles sp.]MBV8036113.1 type II toxin-antitoxin system HipA family toxin YjjJ [Roseateles sp.]